MKALVSVISNKTQNVYNVIGDYIANHAKTIENIIAVIQVNGVIIKELFMVSETGDFYWENDWWEGEGDVTLLDFFQVSDARKSELDFEDVKKWCRERNLIVISQELYFTMREYL